MTDTNGGTRDVERWSLLLDVAHKWFSGCRWSRRTRKEIGKSQPADLGTLRLVTAFPPLYPENQPSFRSQAKNGANRASGKAVGAGHPLFPDW